MNKPTVKDILAGYLIKHNYDGLFHEDGMCACHVNDDLMDHCCEDPIDCVPGFKHPIDCDCGVCVRWREEMGSTQDTIFAEPPPEKE